MTRTYDSRNKAKGDFGIGWTMGVSDIRIEESEVPGEGWYQVSQGGGSILNPFVTYYLQETIQHKVTVTYPSGQTDEFRMNVIPTSSFLQPFDQVNVSFEPLDGTHSTLEAIGDSLLWVVGNVDAPVTLTDDNYVTYNPNRYRLTTLDRTVFVINQESGIETVTDRNGNTLTFGPNGIEHSTGKSVQFERDGENRITCITDPMGRTIEYGYDAYGDLISVRDQEGYETRFTYNNRHDLLDIIDPRGVRATRNEYETSGRLMATIDPDGNRIEFDHDIDARMEVVRDRLGYPTTFYYDDHGNVVREVDALGNSKEYTYDERDNLLTEEDQLGYSTVSTYNAQDLMTSKTNPIGYTVEASYNSRAQVLTLQDIEGLLLTNTYDANGNLEQIKEATGATSDFTYDPSGRPKSYADQIGKVMLFTYDTDGNVQTMTDPEGTLISFNYDDNGNVLSKTSTRTTPTGTETLTTINVYDHLGRIVENVDAAGNVSKVEYNAIGKQAAYIDKRGYRTEYFYDDLGNLERVSYPDGTEETFVYDAEGRNTSSVNREGKETVYTYDKLGRLIKTEAPDGSYTRTEYDERGQVDRQIDERGNETSYTYDAAGRNTEVRNALNQITWYSYALDGKLTRMRDANNHITRYEYDANGRRTTTIFHDDSYVETKYDDAGRVTDEWDQNRKHIGYEYDWRGKLTRVIDALNNETTFEYDEVGNMIAQTDAEGQTTRFEYDNLGRMTKRILPLGQEENMVYDGEDNLTEKTDFNGETISFTYDSDGRVTKKILPDQTVDYVYALDGSQKTITDDRGITTYNYDDMGRLESVEFPSWEGSGVGPISYGYDNAGNRTSVTTPSGTVTYTFDALNRLETATEPATGTTTYAYDNVGNLQTVTYPNGTVAEYTYDALNRLTYLENRTSDGTVISSYSYTLDAAGNRTKVVEHSGRVVEYEYDDAYKLTTETIKEPGKPDHIISYTYDKVGNRKTKTENGFTMTYQYDDNNRLIQEDDITYSYDDNGNLKGKTSAEEAVEYFYDSENHLTRVETTRFGVTIVVEYEYDAEGNRVRKIIDGTIITNYLVDTNRDYAQVLEERDRNGNLLVRYVYGHDLISQTRGGATTYYHYDGLGSTRALTSSAEVVTDTYNYDAFGLILEQTGTTENNYLYRGEQFDPELGFYYLRARYMDPNVGRFVTMDDFSGFSRDPYSLHKYLYANANPITYSDPSGNMPSLSLVGQQIVTAIRGILDRCNIATKITEYRVIRGMIIGAVDAMIENKLTGAPVIGWDVLLGAAVGGTSSAVLGVAGDAIKHIPAHYWAELCRFKILGAVLGTSIVLTLELNEITEAINNEDYALAVYKMAKAFHRMYRMISFWNSFVCFTEETLIYTKDGYTPIKDIEVGDDVYSENVETGEKEVKQVTKVFIRETPVLMHLFIDDVEIRTTPEHPFWVPERGWIPAGKLHVGDLVALSSGKSEKITSITQEVLTQPITVYNFEVEAWHTYFVGKIGVLVHNDCGIAAHLVELQPNKHLKKLTPLSLEEAIEEVLNGGDVLAKDRATARKIFIAVSDPGADIPPEIGKSGEFWERMHYHPVQGGEVIHGKMHIFW